LSAEDVAKKDVAELLFQRQDSRRAAGAFLVWVKGKGGRCTAEEMSRFADELQSGRPGCRLSRVNFYGTVLRRFLDLGLVAKDLRYDPKTRRAVKAYRAVIQPVGRHRPLAPSLMYLVHLIGERCRRPGRVSRRSNPASVGSIAYDSYILSSWYILVPI